MSLVNAVEVPRRAVSLLEPIIGGTRYAQLVQAADQVRQLLAGRTIWNVNSTATGGGVAEMLQALVGYVSDLGIPISWLVITGDARFFAATKHLHNQIHGDLAGGPLGMAEAHHYTRMLTANAVELLGWIRPGDIALLHDPQTAGLAEPLARAGARVVWRILTVIGVLDGAAPQVPAMFVRRDGNAGTVTRPAVVTGEGRPGPDDPVLLQVSRWDRLKDMTGVMRGFADHVVDSGDGYLILAGPSVTEVADDPEGAAIYAECLLQWHDLPPAAQARILLVTLPLDDIDENAAMVNALQRHATVIAQKSLAEGFGLTVSEGMWKGRPVIGSAVGGIIDQIADGTGLLLPDPADLKAFGQAARLLLDDQAEATRLGVAAHTYVRENYLGDVHLMRYAKLLSTLIAEGLSPPHQ